MTDIPDFYRNLSFTNPAPQSLAWGNETQQRMVGPSRPVTAGNRLYLRALRAAEMKAWEETGGDILNFTS